MLVSIPDMVLVARALVKEKEKAKESSATTELEDWKRRGEPDDLPNALKAERAHEPVSPLEKHSINIVWRVKCHSSTSKNAIRR